MVAAVSTPHTVPAGLMDALQVTVLTAPIQSFQSGVINDYMTWMVLRLAVIGGVLALIIR